MNRNQLSDWLHCLEGGMYDWVADEIKKELAKPEPCSKDPYFCWSIRCQLDKVCKNTVTKPEEKIMATDNNTGKKKGFFERGREKFEAIPDFKNRFRTPNQMTEEDEAWDEIERKQQIAKDESFRKEVSDKSWQFISENDVVELGQMSVQKAYEIGYRAGVYAEQRRKHDTK